jgi:hypothetical protein
MFAAPTIKPRIILLENKSCYLGNERLTTVYKMRIELQYMGYYI